jgi:hypothetical protein
VCRFSRLQAVIERRSFCVAVDWRNTNTVFHRILALCSGTKIANRTDIRSQARKITYSLWKCASAEVTGGTEIMY